ncbi:MAG: hypothetical protein Q8N23_12915 [Archangium sp.]|nr:hypothetical protein [Archangium sp.]MDP3153571.1 hypothetical protein [Archangium sp.]MDP3574506.1 hypothetical protein [Archangium sp.]
MKSSIRAVAAIALISAGGAWAVAKGGKLYIKSKDTKVLKDPKAGAAAVATVQPGKEVIWNGASEKDKAFHEIAVDGKKGFVLMSNLSPAAPAKEFDSSSGKEMSAQAFASSGAATKALTPAGVTYAKGNVNKSEAAAEIIYAEQHNFAKGTPAAIATKAKELGGGK